MEGDVIEVVDVVDSGRGSYLFNNVAISVRAVCIGSPAVRLGYMVECGFSNKVTISRAACFKKSFNVTAGKGIECGKNWTVLTTRSALVFGK